MPARLQGDHKAKLASCLVLHRNRLLFPMRDCIISCDAHTGARYQRFALPPDPHQSDITLSPSLMSQLGTLPPAAALTNPDAWILSTFVLEGDLLLVATYQVCVDDSKISSTCVGCFSWLSGLGLNGLLFQSVVFIIRHLSLYFPSSCLFSLSGLVGHSVAQLSPEGDERHRAGVASGASQATAGTGTAASGAGR
jgi:hypothetical protein